LFLFWLHCIPPFPAALPSFLFLVVCLAPAGCDLFDSDAAVDYLMTVKTFFDANPNDFLTIIFTTSKGKSPATMWNPAFD
jgi:hypothetical protein